MLTTRWAESRAGLKCTQASRCSGFSEVEVPTAALAIGAVETDAVSTSVAVTKTAFSFFIENPQFAKSSSDVDE
ncbi:hypothetical protein ATP06_0203780 [Amycolatopsis regifaucium]|uniref:Uncharacterized protein n=1 Tax=Amycolatopsis regifaucium TaxID=546365 RepID=A0ABX3DZY3_9PSEU|nr:hypothetical protein ATP06_0203780 [Amycolatopsis regifaucium]